MKKIAVATLLVTLSLTSPVYAQGWLDSVKSFLGLGDAEAEQTQQPSVNGLVAMLAENLNITEEQAEAGIASLLNYAKTIKPDTFEQLKQQLPGVDSTLDELPDTSGMEQKGLGGLLDKAAEYSESLKAVNDVKKQFEAIGLDPQMIMQYIEQAKEYLDTEEGQQAKQAFMDAFGGLTL